MALFAAGCGRIGFQPASADAADVPPRRGGTVLALDGVGFVTADSVCTALSTAMTVTAWVWPAATQLSATPNVLAFNTANGVNPQNLSLLPWIVSNQEFQYFDDLVTSTDYPPNDPLSVDAWHFVALVIDAAGQGAVYQDGEATITFTTTRVIPSNGRFSLGQEWDGLTPSALFTGFEDDVAVYRVARTEAELAIEMAQGTDPSDPDLVAFFTFENGLSDDSGHGHTGTPQASATTAPAP